MTEATMTGVTAGAKARFLESYRREVATTLKVLRAYPSEQGDMRPHPTSMSARELAWVFTIEQGACIAAIRDELPMPPPAPPAPPATFGECVTAFEGAAEQLASLVEATPEAALSETFEFFVAPQTLGPVPKMDLLLTMLNDQIHHRGQLSVYLRMTGSKVPSIYGPSRDEPWF